MGGTGWRKAFCTTISSRDSDSSANHVHKIPNPSPSPRSCVRLGFFSNPSTPRFNSQSHSTPGLRCRTSQHAVDKTTTSSTPKSAKSQRGVLGSNPSSPRSPLKLSLFKNSFKFRSSCGICLSSVKTGHGTAIYTAECGHAFHFPCIAAHVRNQATLICPVCNTTWKDVPLLAAHQNLAPLDTKPRIEDKPMIQSQSSPKPIKSKLDNRSYDDDEPLLSPTAGGRINPIPEDEDVEEFQGFFVDPKPPSSSVKALNQRANVQVRLLPETAMISCGQTHETYAVALRVKAPPPPPSHPARNRANANLLDPSRRAPVDLVTVLDVSGSMTGAKLTMLKRAMRLVISSLGSSDRLAIVAFSATPKRLFPLRRMTAQGQRAARRVIDTLVCCQGTGVGEALRKATKVLEDRRERNPVASIMLLSDGQDERMIHSNQRHGTRHDSSTRFAHIEIPVHAFGFGESGGYCQEPAEDAFAKCVSGLLSVVVQDLRIQLGFPNGSSPVVISAIYSCTGRPTVCSLGSVRLGDLYAEEERELLVELKIPTSAAGTHHVMTMQCLYKDPSTQEVVYSREQDILVARPVAVRSSAPKIERLRNTFITTRAVAESRRLIEYDDHTSAHHLLASARALLIQSGSAIADAYVRELEVELAELHWRRQQQFELHQQQQQHSTTTTTTTPRRRGGEKECPTMVDENGEPLTPTSAWRAAEKLARVAIMKKSLTSRVGDLHGFENARF